MIHRDIAANKLHRVLAAAISALALTHSANAIEESWRGDGGPKATLKGISREAQQALLCQVVSDLSAFRLIKLIRDDTNKNQAIDPQGMEILQQIRLTEGLASVAFEKLAPEADHDAMYQDAVAKMRVYLKEDREGADSNAQRMVPLCQQTYRKMASEGTLTIDQIQTATDASRESVAKLTEELQARGYSVQQ